VSAAWVVHEGDCLALLPTIGEVSAVITDPPYGIGLKNNGNFSRSWHIANDDSTEAAASVAGWADGRRVPLCMFGSPYRPLPGHWRNILAWDKGPAVGAGGDPKTCWKRTFDLVFIRNNRPLRRGRDAAVLKFWQSPNYRDDFAYHPAQKPVALLKYLIEQLTPEGGTVLDPFCGSGSTGVACVQTGRKFIGIELDPAHAEIARGRLADASATLFGAA
jgi:site-specific DNA-methyltransferase (adenine-specific)